MALDITLENNGVVYACGLSEQHSGYRVDIRIPGHGHLLSTQVHGLELLRDKLTGKYVFYSIDQPIPGDIKMLEEPLNQALQNLLDKPAT